MTIEELVARGRVAYLAFADRYYEDRPVGAETLFVVTREDFIRHPALCLDALRVRASLYVLDTGGSIQALLCRHSFT